MGRIVTPFRIKLDEKIAELRKEFQSVLIDLGRRRAFDKIVEAWDSEAHAMSFLIYQP